MITIHVERETLHEAVTTVLKELGLSLNLPQPEVPTAPPGSTPVAPVPAPAPVAPAPAAPAPTSDAPFTSKKRGRRTKAEIAAAGGLTSVPPTPVPTVLTPVSTSAAPAPTVPPPAAPVPTVPPPAAPTPVPTVPPPAAPTPVPAPAPAPSTPPAGAATYDEMKAALQKVAILRPNDVGSAGIQRASAILEKYGVKKVKDVSWGHYASIITDCEESMKTAQVK